VKKASQKRLAFAGVNPDLFPDDGTDFRFDAFNEGHANPAEFVGWPDRSGYFQRGLFYLAAAKMRSGIDAFECACHFNCFHNFSLGCGVDSFNDTTILSVALLLNRKCGNCLLVNIEQNHRNCRCLTQKDADFMRGNQSDFQI
jgi:hypothetical protein